MLFPPTEREAVLAEVRAALLAKCKESAVESADEWFPGFLWGEEIVVILDGLARKAVKEDATDG